MWAIIRPRVGSVENYLEWGTNKSMKLLYGLITKSQVLYGLPKSLNRQQGIGARFHDLKFAPYTQVGTLMKKAEAPIQMSRDHKRGVENDLHILHAPNLSTFDLHMCQGPLIN